MERTRRIDKFPQSVSAQSAKKRLRWMLCLFCIGLTIPLVFLIHKVYSQFEHESYFHYRSLAENLVNRIDQQLTQTLSVEEKRPFAEYSFFNVEENPLIKSRGVAFSPLSQFPPNSDIPGIVGYFQINPDSSFHSPVLPELDKMASNSVLAGLSQTELQNRLALQNNLRNLLVSQESQRRKVKSDSTAGIIGSLDQTKSKEEFYESSPLKKPSAQSRLSIRSLFDQLFNDDYRSSNETESSNKQPQEAELVAAQKLRTAEEDFQVLPESKLVEQTIDTERWQFQSRETKFDQAQNIEQKATAKGRIRRKERVEIPDQAAASEFYNTAPPSRSMVRDEQRESADDAESKQQVLASKIETTIDRKLEQESTGKQNQRQVAILRFESEIDPLKLLLLQDPYFCFYRNVWQNDGRYIQGFIVNRREFFQTIVASTLQSSQIGRLASVLLVSQGNILEQLAVGNSDSTVFVSAEKGKPETGKPALLYRSFALAPFNEIELLVTAENLPISPGTLLVDGLVVVLAFVLVGGLFGLYRIGAKQMDLANQQTNFVSAVSHELKTPLTSIRMYSELLRSGWVEDKTKQKSYYDFIFFESERLSRLIANVLELSKISHNNSQLQLNPYSPESLLQMVREKVQSQVEAAGFRLNIIAPENDKSASLVEVDEDSFNQIFINLVDNALKFCSDGTKVVDVGVYPEQKKSDRLVFFVRDYGPGIHQVKKKHLFKLFYRGENELTRTKPGSGIGLALVKQLAQRMNATVELVNRQPGLEVLVSFPKQ